MGEIRAIDNNGVQTMNYAFLVAGKTKDVYVSILRSADRVYANRFGLMVAITLLAFVLITAVAFMSTIVLNRVVELCQDFGHKMPLLF